MLVIGGRYDRAMGALPITWQCSGRCRDGCSDGGGRSKRHFYMLHETFFQFTGIEDIPSA